MTGADRVTVATSGQSLADFGVGSDKSISDLIDEGVTVDWAGTTGSVTGNIHNISDGWTGYAKTANTGHFFPVVLDEQYEGQKITVVGQKTKTVQDRYWVLRVENAKDNKFTFKVGEDELFTLDFSTATLEP